MSADRRKRGTALISTLLIVTVMSAVAVELMGDMRTGIRRSANAGERDQAYWHALGARDYAEALLARAMRDPEAAMRPDAPWLGNAQVFPIDGGRIEARLRDGQTCFNINSLVTEDEPGVFTADPGIREQFEQVLQSAGLPPAIAARIPAEASDWIDSDTRPGPGGAEDAAYAGATPPYRPANALMIEIEEMRALRSMTPAIHTVIARHVCALPEARALPVNVNTLQVRDAGQLAARFPGRLSRLDAESVLLRRPSAGYASESDVWADPVMASLEPDADDLAQVTLVSSWFEISVRVISGDAEFHLDSVVSVSEGGRLTRHGQRFGSLS